jgi:hypothetical protein
MTAQTSTPGELVATVDVRELHSIRWGMMRQMFPRFIEDIELGRYLRTLLTSGHYEAVRIVPHRGPDGQPSSHVFHVYRLGEA